MTLNPETVPAHHETPDLAELRRLAEAVQMPGDDPDIIGRWWDAGDLALYPVSYRQDREFIQACSPDVVLALLAERDALAAKVERVRELHFAHDCTSHAGTATICAHRPGICLACLKPLPCPTIRALDTTPDTGGES